MKTDFPVLWVDDNKDFVESLENPLKSWIDEKGFDLKVAYHKNATGMIADLKKGDIELVIIDLNLPGKKGDALIAEIRAGDFYHDIIFYSQGGIPHGVFQTPPDGVFFVDRADAKDRIKNLITLKIRRASDLATLRGWVVADAIDLEHELGKVLSKCFRDMETVFHQRVLTHEGLFDCGKKFLVLSGILKDHVDSLKKAGKDELFKKFTACKKVLDSFPDDVIEVRNALAHQAGETAETGHKMVKTRNKKAKSLIFSEEKCIEIRKNLRRHQANLADLLTLV